MLNLGGNLKFVGGAGSATVEAFNFTGLPPGGGGLSGTTIFGSVDGDNILYSSLSNAGGLDYQAGLGNETLNASGSKTSDTLAAGPGNVAMTVGSGITDLLLVQSIIGGAGSVLGGASDSVSGFAGNAGNFVDIMGYASGSGAVTTVSGGSSLLTLTDGTKITFENVSSSALVAAIKYT